MKYLRATLKTPVYAVVKFEPDFIKEPLRAVAQTEQMKRNLNHTIRQKLHECIATLSIDDLIEFEFIEKN